MKDSSNIRIAALFVLYYPSKDDMEYINNFAKQFEYCFYFDNTPTKGTLKDCISSADYYSDKEGHNRKEYYSDGINHGLAYAYNETLKKAYTSSIEWLAVFDQDSRMEDIQSIVNYIYNSNSNDAVICPYISYDGAKPNIRGAETIRWTINSGSFLNVRLLKNKNISYDEYYFLDRLDRDFCKQIETAKLRIRRVYNSVLFQSLGEIVNKKSVHSPLRNYYMARNRLYYNHKFYPIPIRWIYNILQTTNHVVGIIRSGEKVNENIKSIQIGIADYLKGNGGKKVLI